MHNVQMLSANIVILFSLVFVVIIQGIVIYKLYFKLAELMAQILAYAAFKSNGTGASHAVIAAGQTKLHGIANQKPVPQIDKDDKSNPLKEPKKKPFTITHTI